MAPSTHEPRPASFTPGHTRVRWIGRGLLAAVLAGSVLSPAGHPQPTTAPQDASLVEQRSEATSRSAQRELATEIRLSDAASAATFTAHDTVLRDALAERGVTLGPDDIITPDLATALTGEPVIVTITRGLASSVTGEEVLAHTTRTVEDPNLPVGTTKVIQAGSDGLTRTVYRVTTDAVTGAELTREADVTIAVSSPVEEVIAQGTKPAPVITSRPAAASAPVEPGTARALGADAVAARGWGPEQFTCLDSLWTHESGWSTTAGNPTSGAYGIPQSLPGEKMASAGSEWRTDAATQISWGLGYIAGRYTTPCGAWAHWQAKNWY